MIRVQCARVAPLLQARAAGLSQASALVLEEHLTHCSDCSEQAHLLDSLRALSDAAAAPLSSGARQRAVLRAFAVAERPPQPSAAPSSWLVPSLSGVLVAGLIVLASIIRQPELAPLAGVRVLSGALEHTTHAAASGEIETAIASRAGGTVALAHATLEFRAQTRARWSERARVLQLETGSVLSDVDPAAQLPFRVATEHFRVLVLGTQFEVSSSAVRVTRGRVRVERPDGTQLAVLGAGESYACARAPCSPRVKFASEVAVTPARVPAAADVAPQSPAAQRERVAAPEAIDHRLEQARLALARHNIALARTLVSNLLAEDLQSRERAEALSLRAECALVAGDLAGASAGYRVVARRFASLPAGENALFASARIDADRLPRERAQAGLMGYLARYPQGRFVKEATTRLRELRESSRTP